MSKADVAEVIQLCKDVFKQRARAKPGQQGAPGTETKGFFASLLGKGK
jgi:hypothetical protein